MLDECDDLLLNQYLEGDLPPAVTRLVDIRLSQEPEFSAALEQYRRLNALLNTPLQEIRWDAFAEHLCAAVAKLPNPMRN
jgi:anti-sigma factor RsiW